jgi:uncharacterized protein YxjI
MQANDDSVNNNSDATPENRYKIRQHLISIGDDFYVETTDGRRAFFVDGKVLRLRKTFVLQDMQGREMATIEKRLLAMRDTMDIYREGRVLATVRKAWLNVLRDRYIVNRKGAPDWEVKGDLFDHEYAIYQGDQRIAQISKRWFSFTDTYGIDVLPGLDDALIIAVCIVIDEMIQEDKPIRE